eukprot:3896065-Amphidinium_carterae.2
MVGYTDGLKCVEEAARSIYGRVDFLHVIAKASELDPALSTKHDAVVLLDHGTPTCIGGFAEDFCGGLSGLANLNRRWAAVWLWTLVSAMRFDRLLSAATSRSTGQLNEQKRFENTFE